MCCFKLIKLCSGRTVVSVQLQTRAPLRILLLTHSARRRQRCRDSTTFAIFLPTYELSLASAFTFCRCRGCHDDNTHHNRAYPAAILALGVAIGSLLLTAPF